jgi:phosphoglycerate kinase
VLGADLDLLELVTAAAPVRPYTALIGGQSFRRKAKLLWALSMRVDTILLGGAVANTCLAARGAALGRSACEPEEFEAARAFLAATEARGVAVHLPLDVLVQQASGALELRASTAVAEDEAVVDVALETCLAYRGILENSATVVWNGLLGTCDREDTRSGTYRCAQVVPGSARHNAVFGARTVAMAEQMALAGSFQRVSRSGPGALEMFGGTILPGVESLRSGR